MGKEEEDTPETKAPGAPDTGVVQIDRSIGEAWAAIEELDVGKRGRIDLRDLNRKQVLELAAILQRNRQGALASKVAATLRQVDESDDESDDDVAFADPVAAFAKRTEHVDPPAILELLEGPYRGRARKYRGPSAEVKSKLSEDPLVALLFPSLVVFLDVVGWEVMCQRRADMDDVVTVELTILEGKEGTAAVTDDQVSINTAFPYGTQDSTVTYQASGDRFVITEFYRHRSVKTERAPDHTFVAIVEQQARGVVALGPQCGYRSNAIKDDLTSSYGYNVWPKMGFDADVPQSYLTAMLADRDLDLMLAVAWLRTLVDKGVTPRFARMFSVTTPKTYKQLGDLWRKHGGTVGVWFDPTPNSPSRQALATYKAMRNIR